MDPAYLVVSDRHPGSRGSGPVLALSFGFGLMVGAFVLALGLEPPEGHGVADWKRTLLSRWASADIMVVGNSRPFRSIDPFAIDRALGERGFEITTLNLSAQLQTWSEAIELLTLAEQYGARPQVILLDPRMVVVDPANWSHPRRIRQPAGITLRWALMAEASFIGLGDLDLAAESAHRAFLILASWAAGQLHLGTAAHHLGWVRQPDHWMKRGMQSRGFFALESEGAPGYSRRSARWKRKGRKTLPLKQARCSGLSGSPLRYAERFRALANRLGAPLVLYFGPEWIESCATRGWMAWADERRLPVWRMPRTDPRFEAFYRRDVWFDGWHLGQRGVGLVTNHLVDLLSAALGP